MLHQVRLVVRAAPRALVLPVLLAAAAVTAPAQSGPPAGPAVAASAVPAQKVPRLFRGRIVGVFDEATGDPIEGAEVKDMLNGLSALTTRTGTLSLFFVDTTAAMIRVRKLGYDPITLMVSNLVTDTIPLTLVLTPTIHALPAVVTRDSLSRNYNSPMLRGFESRLAGGHGTFIGAPTLQKEGNRRMADVLRAHIPGVNFLRGGGSALYMVTNRGESTKMDGTSCHPDVFLDGVFIQKSEDSQRRTTTRVVGKQVIVTPGLIGVDISQWTVSDFAGIEYHNVATMPPEYNATNSGCGALLLWTRER